MKLMPKPNPPQKAQFKNLKKMGAEFPLTILLTMLGPLMYADC